VAHFRPLSSESIQFRTLRLHEWIRPSLTCPDTMRI